MLYDVRTYTCKPGTLKKQLALYEEYGFEAQKRHLGEPVVYLVAETGNPNSYTHIWAYQDAADRAARRAALHKDPGWQVFLQKSNETDYLEKQENVFMSPAPFFKR